MIDADMRKPSQNGLIGVESSSGLLDYLLDNENTASGEFYDVDPKSGMGVILGRGRSDVPTDQPLQSDAFVNLLETARNSFDVIVIDTPPLLPVVDARYVAALSDCVLLVVRAGSTSQSQVRAGWGEIAEALGSADNVLSVLNFGERKTTSYRYGGGYYTE